MEHAAGVDSAALFPFSFVSFGDGGLTLQSGPQDLPASASHKLLFDSRPLPFFIFTMSPLRLTPSLTPQSPSGSCSNSGSFLDSEDLF